MFHLPKLPSDRSLLTPYEILRDRLPIVTSGLDRRVSRARPAARRPRPAQIRAFADFATARLRVDRLPLRLRSGFGSRRPLAFGLDAGARRALPREQARDP